MNLCREALAAMAADNAFRYVGVEGDLFAFEDLRAWAPGADGSLPLVVAKDAPPFERVDDLGEYQQRAG